MGFTCITIRAIIQKSEICFCGSPIFCCVAGLDVRTFGPKPNALSRKGLPQKSRSEFCGKRRNKPPSQAARDAAADFTALFRRRDQKVVGPAVASTIQKGVDLRQLLFVFLQCARRRRASALRRRACFPQKLNDDRLPQGGSSPAKTG